MNNENENKKCHSVWLSPNAMQKVRGGVNNDEAKNLSEWIEKAIHYYAGYCAAENHSEYIAEAVSETVHDDIKATEGRMAKQLFRIAVELAKLTNMLASINEMDDDTMKQLTTRCIAEVKKINGVIRFEDAVKYQRSDD